MEITIIQAENGYLVKIWDNGPKTLIFASLQDALNYIEKFVSDKKK